MSKQKKANSSAHTSRSQAGRNGQKKRRVNPLRVTILVFIIVLLIAIAIAAFLFAKSSKGNQTPENAPLFGVKAVMVEGSTHYTDHQIIEASGIYEGQNLFFVNKRRAAETVLESFPYVEKVTISNPSFSKIKIAIEEARAAGIVPHDGGWLIVGENGKGLEHLPLDSGRCGDYRVLSCSLSKEAGVGKPSMDTRRRDIVKTLTETLNAYELSGILEINLTDVNDIRLNWEDRIVIRLGNDTNLVRQIGVVSNTLGRIRDSHGSDASGQLDLRSYSDSDLSNDKAVFTPQELLPSENPEPDTEPEENPESTNSAAE